MEGGQRARRIALETIPEPRPVRKCERFLALPFFTLETLDAKDGECFIIHYGPIGSVRFGLVDGGPRRGLTHRRSRHDSPRYARVSRPTARYRLNSRW